MYEKRLRNLKNKITVSFAVAAAVKGVYEVTTEDLKNKEKTLQFTNSKNLSRNSSGAFHGKRRTDRLYNCSVLLDPMATI